MKLKLTSTIIALCISVPALADDSTPDADHWYKKVYAPLYADAAAVSVDALAAHFSSDLDYHAADGTMSKENGKTWIGEGVESWLSDGWLGSRLVGYESDMINATTASFKAKWHDAYEGGNEGFECGWYLADYTDDGWVITQYADLDCDAHGL